MKKGFTLIELLVVVLIVGILSAVALPQYQTAVERSRATEALTQMNALRTSLERHYAQHDAFPTDNNLNTLDVDLPCVTEDSSGNCTAFGGKYFTIQFTSTNGVATIAAYRANNGTAVTGGDGYTLSTVLSPTSSGAFTAERHCIPLVTTDTEYCDAISGGHTGSSENF